MTTTTSSLLTREEVLRRAQAVMEERGLDALIAQSNANTFYMAGTSFMVQRIGGKRLGIIVTFRNGHQVFIYERTEVEHARTESWVPKLREYVEFVQHPIDVLADVLRENGVDTVGQRYERTRAKQSLCVVEKSRRPLRFRTAKRQPPKRVLILWTDFFQAV